MTWKQCSYWKQLDDQAICNAVSQQDQGQVREEISSLVLRLSVIGHKEVRGQRSDLGRDGLTSTVREGAGRSCEALIPRSITDNFSLKEHVYLAEAGTQRLVAIPALEHQVVDLSRAAVRTGQEGLQPVVLVTVAAVLNDLFVTQCAVWLLLSECQHLPQGHSERPYVWLRCESTLDIKRCWWG